MTNALTQVGPLRAALAEATEAGDLSKLRDIAAIGHALQTGARARSMGIDAENEAAEVVIRAERAMGRTLLLMREQGLIAPRGAPPSQWTSRDATSVQTLEQLGLGSGTDRNRVKDWQQLARMSAEDFEAEIVDAHDHARRLSRVNFLRKHAAGPSDSALKVGSPANEGLDLVRKGTHALVGWGVDDDGDGFAFADKATIQYLATDELVELANLIRMLAAAYTAEKTRR